MSSKSFCHSILSFDTEMKVWLEFVSALFGSIAWPAVVIAVILELQKTLAERIPRGRSFTGKVRKVVKFCCLKTTLRRSCGITSMASTMVIEGMPEQEKAVFAKNN
ncbi:hypothetical protein FHS27_003203 [Rhodopirellula rubra]|uniref:Uncharacterized protein n=1 Tax=Aporhodopirellula rubra TaxID=980271 RepID=A0A7W5H5E0_9BACT|nr:hypothetical protein [Aporhodopirellula rubra]MBB3207382.1 hypothetical protein [Aporhodopirellula rubra]